MCTGPDKQDATRMLFEMHHEGGSLRVIDPDSGCLLFDGGDEILPSWVAKHTPSEPQQRLLGRIAALAAQPPMPAAPQPADVAPPTESKRVRRKLWELKGAYHCPVIGTCAGISELRKVARQARLVSEVRLSDYEVHSSFVALASQRCPASRQLHKLLDQKHARSIKHFSQAKDGQALYALWTEARADGDIAGALWALMTHPGTTPELAQEAYETIHMLSHEVGAMSRAESRRAAELTRENRRLERELSRNAAKSAESLAAKSLHIEVLNERLARSRAAEARLEALESGEALHKHRVRIGELERELATALLRAERAERKAQQRNGKPRQSLPMIAVPAAEPLPDTPCSECENNDACPQLDLCGRCVLCVGGLTGTVDRYRRLVEGSNGRFLHHDGGAEERDQRLDALLQRADAVICPADCISHNAVRRVKRYCKRHHKTCLFPRSAGTGALSGALIRLADSTGKTP